MPRILDRDAAFRQWDAFFKEIAPHSAALREVTAAYLSVNAEDLLPGERYSSEFRSRTVALALHQKGQWKEFRVDGLYSTRAF